MTKWEFIEGQLIASSIQGALGRGCVYVPVAPEDRLQAQSDPRRRALRDQIGVRLRALRAQYESQVSNEEHQANIFKLSEDLTLEFGGTGLLRENRFRIGTAQKLLNLYLKYMWCLERVATPPHCPFDSQIIARLHLTERRKQELQWTKVDSLSDYQSLVDAANMLIEGTHYASLAEWELDVWGSDSMLADEFSA